MNENSIFTNQTLFCSLKKILNEKFGSVEKKNTLDWRIKEGLKY